MPLQATRYEHELDEVKEQRDELLAALKAARDLLVGCQKCAGYLPEQGGYSTTFTGHEMELARGIESLDAIVARAEEGHRG